MENNQMPRNDQQSYQTQGGGGGGMAPIMSMGEWVKTLLLLIIPLVNIILLIVWATSNDPGNNPNKKNWAKAQLVVMLIGVAISIVITILMAILGAALFSGSYYY